METFIITITDYGRQGSLVTCPCGFSWMALNRRVGVDTAKDHRLTHEAANDKALLSVVRVRDTPANGLLERRAFRSLDRA